MYLFCPYFRQAKRMIFNVYFVHGFQWLFLPLFLTCILHMIFSPFFHVICHAKSERFVDVKIERFFEPMTSCHPFFFIPIVATRFRSDDQCVHACFHVSYFEKRHVVHTYRLSWRGLVCWKKTAFSWRNNPWIVLAVDFQKDSFERSLPFLFFIVAVLRPIFAQTLTASIFCFFAWSKK